MTTEYVCATCGSDMNMDGLIPAVCEGCGSTERLPWELYDDVDGRQPATADHSPRKHAMLSSEGEYVVAEERNPEAWVCVDVGESEDGIVEVRE